MNSTENTEKEKICLQLHSVYSKMGDLLLNKEFCQYLKDSGNDDYEKLKEMLKFLFDLWYQMYVEIYAYDE